MIDEIWECGLVESWPIGENRVLNSVKSLLRKE